MPLDRSVNIEGMNNAMIVFKVFPNVLKILAMKSFCYAEKESKKRNLQSCMTSLEGNEKYVSIISTCFFSGFSHLKRKQ